MKHRIFELDNANCKAVALNLVRDFKTGNDVVCLSLWMDIDGQDIYAETVVQTQSHEMCERFIADFTEETAQAIATQAIAAQTTQSSLIVPASNGEVRAVNDFRSHKTRPRRRR